jgi:hypothetical protein
MPGDAQPRSAIRYIIPVALLAILLAIALGDGFIKTRRAERNTATLKSGLAAMSIQELSSQSKACDESPAGRATGNRDSDYCAAVWREIEARPLQIVEPAQDAGAPQARTPSSPPR